MAQFCCVTVAPSGFCPSASHSPCISLGLLVPQAQAGLELEMGCEELASGLRGCELLKSVGAGFWDFVVGWIQTRGL